MFRGIEDIIIVMREQADRLVAVGRWHGSEVYVPCSERIAAERLNLKVCSVPGKAQGRLAGQKLAIGHARP